MPMGMPDKKQDAEGMSAFHETELTADVTRRRRTRGRSAERECGGGRV